MSDALNGMFGQPGLDAAESMQRVERLDRDSPDRERREQEELQREKRRLHVTSPGHDRVEISEAALRALQAASRPVTGTRVKNCSASR